MLSSFLSILVLSSLHQLKISKHFAQIASKNKKKNYCSATSFSFLFDFFYFWNVSQLSILFSRFTNTNPCVLVKTNAFIPLYTLFLNRVSFVLITKGINLFSISLSRSVWSKCNRDAIFIEISTLCLDLCKKCWEI